LIYFFSILNYANETTTKPLANMKPLEEHDLVIRIIKHCLGKPSLPKSQIFLELDIDQNSQQYVERYLLNNEPNNVLPNHILGRMVQANDHLQHQYKLLPTAIFQYVDYLEIKEARKNSKQAFWLSILAIILSVVVGGIQIFISI
jgi:hypothetical protein